MAQTKQNQYQRTQRFEQVDDDYNISERFNQGMKSITQDGHATEGAPQNYNRISGSPLQFHNRFLHDPFHMCRKGGSSNQVCGSLPGNLISILNKFAFYYTNSLSPSTNS